MNIKTKYSIGDICYVMEKNKITELKITKINIAIDSDGIEVHYLTSRKDNTTYSSTMSEKNIITDKGDLVKKLLNDIA